MLLLHANGQGILSSMHPSADSAALSRLPAPNANGLVFAELVSRSLGLTIPSPPPSPVACPAEYEPSQWPATQTSSGGLSKINKAGCEVKTGNPSPAWDVCALAPWLAGQATPCALAAATMKGPARQ